MDDDRHGFPISKMFSLAWSEATKSPDLSVQNGAIIATPDGYTFSGCNTFPRGTLATPEKLDRPLKYAFAEHAERNAVYEAARRGGACSGGVMVCLWAACADCARAIVQSGIVEFVRHRWYTDHTPERWLESIRQGDEILRDGGVAITEWDRPIDTGGKALRFLGEEIDPWGPRV